MRRATPTVVLAPSSANHGQANIVASKNDGVLWGVGKSAGTGHINFARVDFKLGIDHTASAPPSTWGSIKARYH